MFLGSGAAWSSAKHPLNLVLLFEQNYAAREKNGVYIPREQHLADEAEKKVLTPFITYDILDCAYSSIA